jgi:UDP-N-acetylglucosamine 2-epimerase
VQFVPHEKNAIINAIQMAVFDESYNLRVKRCRNPYGDGKSSHKIAEIIASTIIDDRLLIKDITY